MTRLALTTARALGAGATISRGATIWVSPETAPVRSVHECPRNRVRYMPDIELTGLSGKNGTLASSADKAQKKRRAATAGPERRITIRLTKEQVQRITKCCHQAGERELAEQIVSQLRS